MNIETRNASIDTLAVTIKALHVSGKQMTLAVFRQLPIGVETDDSDLWGIVRYAIKDEGELWLVFSKDGKLFRRRLIPMYNRAAFEQTYQYKNMLSDVGRIERDLKLFAPIANVQESEFYVKKRKELEGSMEYMLSVIKREREEYDKETRDGQRDAKLATLCQLFISV